MLKKILDYPLCLAIVLAGGIGVGFATIVTVAVINSEQEITCAK